MPLSKKLLTSIIRKLEQTAYRDFAARLCQSQSSLCRLYCVRRRPQWPRGLRRGSAAARLLRLWVRIPPGALMSVPCECCVLSVRCLCNELIARPGESYWPWCFVECNLETSSMRRSWPTGVCCDKRKIYCDRNRAACSPIRPRFLFKWHDTKIKTKTKTTPLTLKRCATSLRQVTNPQATQTPGPKVALEPNPS